MSTDVAMAKAQNMAVKFLVTSDFGNEVNRYKLVTLPSFALFDSQKPLRHSLLKLSASGKYSNFNSMTLATTSV